MGIYEQQSKAFEMTGVCGIYCSECECHKAKYDSKIMEYLINRGMNAVNLPCPGCRGVIIL